MSKKDEENRDDSTGEYQIGGRAITRIFGEMFEGEPGVDSSPSASGDSSLVSMLDDGGPDSLGDGAPRLNDALMVRVMAAAKEIVVRKGLFAVTLDELRHEAELTSEELAKVVLVFPTGDAVAAEVVHNLFMPLIADMSEIALRTNKILEALVQVGERQVHRLQRESALYIASIEASLQPNPRSEATPRVTATLEASQRHRHQILAAIVAQGQLNGEIRKGDPEVIAHAIGASLMGVSIRVANSSALAAAGVYGVDVSSKALELLARGLKPSKK